MFWLVLTASLALHPVGDAPAAADGFGIAGAWRVTTLALDKAHRNVNGHYTFELVAAGGTDYTVRVTRAGDAIGHQAAPAPAGGEARLQLAPRSGGGVTALQAAFDVTLAQGTAADPMRFELTFSHRDANSPWTCDGYFEHRGAVFVVPEGDPDGKGEGHGSTFWGVLSAARGAGKPLSLSPKSALSCFVCCDAFWRCSGTGPGACNSSNTCRDACLEASSNGGSPPAKACIAQGLRDTSP